MSCVTYLHKTGQSDLLSASEVHQSSSRCYSLKINIFIFQECYNFRISSFDCFTLLQHICSKQKQFMKMHLFDNHNNAKARKRTNITSLSSHTFALIKTSYLDFPRILQPQKSWLLHSLTAHLLQAFYKDTLVKQP